MANTKKATKGKERSGTPSDNITKKERMDDNAGFIIMPEVSDIPGQEKIVDAGIPQEMADITASSDDEEGIRDGKDILDTDDSDVDIVMGTEADVTEEDIALLGDKEQDMDLGDDELESKAGLDDRDFDGDPLNEAAVDTASTGDDLDIPDTGETASPRSKKKTNDAMDQGDEENDYYSLGGDKD